MNLSIKEYSAFVTHLIVFLLGFSLANVWRGPKLEGYVKHNRVLIPISTKKIISSKLGEVYSEQKMLLVRERKELETKLCVFSDAIGKIQRFNQDFYLSSKLSEAKVFLKVYENSFYLIPSDQALLINDCSQVPEVSYDSSGML